VKLTLVDDETKQQVGQAVSINGNYKFQNVFPGKYSISAEHTSWTFVKVLRDLVQCGILRNNNEKSIMSVGEINDLYV